MTGQSSRESDKDSGNCYKTEGAGLKPAPSFALASTLASVEGEDFFFASRWGDVQLNPVGSGGLEVIQKHFVTARFQTDTS